MLKPSAVASLGIPWEYDEAEPWNLTLWPGVPADGPGFLLEMADDAPGATVIVYRPNGAELFRAIDEPGKLEELVELAAAVVQHWGRDA